MSRSQKPPIIESLFDRHWDSQTGTLSDPVVTLQEVQEAIREYNAAHPDLKKPLSDRNPANFVKDIVRRRSGANRIWPQSVFERGYFGRQLTGDGRCFEFVPVLTEQAVPYPIAEQSSDLPRYRIESASLPLASRRLGRSDETWLVQVVVRQRVIETHLALVSEREVIQVDHLQMGIKHRNTEIDALFLVLEEAAGERRELIICCEAKALNQDIIEEQMVNQVKTVFRLVGVTQDLVLPMAVQTVGTSLIHVSEFRAVTRQEADDLSSLELANGALYEFVPKVPGIGTRTTRKSRGKKRLSVGT